MRRELDSGEPVDRQLPQLFALLSLVLERGPLQIAWAAMKAQDRALRGTALEYLSNVLPADVFAPPLVLRRQHRPRAGRPRPGGASSTDELRASSVGLRIEQPPWREGGETADRLAGRRGRAGQARHAYCLSYTATELTAAPSGPCRSG